MVKVKMDESWSLQEPEISPWRKGHRRTAGCDESRDDTPCPESQHTGYAVAPSCHQRDDLLRDVADRCAWPAP